MNVKKIKKGSIPSIVLVLIILFSYNYQDEIKDFINKEITKKDTIVENNKVTLDNIPEYSGNPYVILNGNEPNFEDKDKITESFEIYNALDNLGRCTWAYANVSLYTMPDEKRGSIGSIKPTAWHTVKYDNIDGKYLYNRCHLIGYQLTGENANIKNLITCTRYMNTVGMLEFENKVATYVKETNNHVLYRVTPIYDGDNLLASGVVMEGYSVEDNGKGIKFNVYVYNVQDGIEIDYSNGDSKLKEVSR